MGVDVAQFPVNPQRLTPYANFRFKVTDAGSCVAGASKVSGLSHSVQSIEFRSGGDSEDHLVPGQTSYGPITLERGITADPAFLQWVNKAWYYSSSKGSGDMPLADFRKDLTIELYNEAGQKVMAYTLSKAWPSEFIALPELDALGYSTAIQSLTLPHEGWQRDETITPPTEPSFTSPT